MSSPIVYVVNTKMLLTTCLCLSYYIDRVWTILAVERNTVGTNNKNHKNKLMLLPAFGIAALSSAVILGAAPASYADTSATAKVTVNVGAVLAVTAAEDITINISAPSPTGVFATGTGAVSVSTNNTTGYSVYLTSNTEATTLDHETVATSKINSIASEQSVSGTGAKFSTANTWGWSNDGENFKPVMAAGTANGASTLFRQSSAPAPSGDSSNLTIGVTANSALASGKYNGTVLLTTITN